LGKNQRKSETKQDLWQIGGAGVFGDSGMRNGETQRERVGFCIFSQKSKEKALSRLKPPLLDVAPVFSLTCGTRFTGPTWQQEGSFF
jgi:hypothetical protein